jgi:DNA-binding transcriptional ArsR family regulator
VFAALGNEHRRRILDLLRDGPQTTGALAAAFAGLSRYAVMQHLGVLAEAGLVLYRTEGRRRLNFLNPVPLQRAYERWMRPLAQTVAADVLRLERHLLTPKETHMSDTLHRVIRIEAETRINRPPEVVFEALTTGLNAWWPHRTRDDATIVYEPKVGGRLYEDWGGGAGLAYGQVIHYDPPRKQVAVFTGGFGTLMYTSRNTDEVIADGEGTIYKKTLVMAGEVSEELEAMFRGGAGSLPQALKAHLEKGV